MNIFYNKQGIGDVLLITLKYDEVSDYLQEKKRRSRTHLR